MRGCSGFEDIPPDEPPQAPPPTMRCWSTPKKLGQRPSTESQIGPLETLEPRSAEGHSASSRPGADAGLPGKKAYLSDQKDLYGRAGRAESGDLRNLRSKGQEPTEFHAPQGHLKFRNTKSSSLGVLDPPEDKESTSETWVSKPKDAAYAALRYLGLVPKVSKAAHKPVPKSGVVVAHLLEFALSVCFASAAECRALADACEPEDKKALLRLLSLAERTHLLGRGVVVSPGSDATLTPAELVYAFLDTKSRPTGHQGGYYGRHGSAESSMLSGGRSQSRVCFDEGSSTSDDRPLDLQASADGHLPRQDSLLSNQSGVNYLMKLGRLESDLESMDVAPAFVEFLMVVLKGQESNTQSVMSSKNDHQKGTDLVLDLKLGEEHFRSADLNEDDTASVLTHQSHCDASLMGSLDGEEKEPISAEIARISGEKGKQVLRIMFNSKCLRTQNRWQQHLLAQQRALLGVITGRLEAAERSLRQDEEVKEEERELLRGFRKIVRRKQGADAVQAPVEVFIVEQQPKRRAEAQELCRILSYPCQPFSSFTKATQAVAQASQGTIQRVVSMISQKSGRSGIGGVPDLLEDRPGGSLEDWRCRAICTTGRNAGNVMLETPTQIVFLGMQCLSRGLQLPAEWQQRVSVVLLTEAGDFEEVGRLLEASGEGEIREKLRAKGICDYLIHPLSLDSLSKVISSAEERRLEEYLLLDILGRGGTACVHKAKRLLDNETLALKEINMRRVNKVTKEAIDRELRLLRELRWPSVIFMLDAWENEKEKLRYVVMPLLDGGCLSQRIETARLGEGDNSHYMDLVADWFSQTVHGLSYMHWRGVIHRDVKPGNLLVGQDTRVLQIGDLGSAVLLPGTGPWPSAHAHVRAPVTSPAYASPEALIQEIHLAASDVWCVGGAFFEALTLDPLFPDAKSIEEAQAHVRAFDPVASLNGTPNHALAAMSTLGKFRSQSSAAAVELAGTLPDLLRPDFLQRPTMAEIASRSFYLKRLKTLLKETGAVPKGMMSNHLEDYKVILKQSLAAKNVSANDAGVSPVSSQRGRGPRLEML